MGSWDDDDDWVGEPPEGRHTRDQSHPEFWTQNRPLVVAVFWFVLFLLIVLVVVLAL